MVITGMQSGGAERVMATLCNALSKRHSVRLLAMKQAVSDYELSEAVEFIGGNVQNKSLAKSVAFTKKQMEAWEPDVVLSFMTKSNIIALLARMFSACRAPVVIAERANPYNAHWIFRIIRRVLYPMADGCVFQTEQAKAYYNGILKCESVILKNPLNPDFAVSPYEGVRKKKVVTMGRLNPVKNQQLLIRAFAEIAPQHPEYTLELYGDGPLRQELEELIQSLGMEQRIFLMGRKHSVRDYVQDAEIFVLSSNAEGMPNALLEAMAMGLCCVATDCPIGGPAAIVRNGENGLLLPMNDCPAMAQALDKLMRNPELAERMGREARNISADFEFETVCAQWEAYLKKFCG